MKTRLAIPKAHLLLVVYLGTTLIVAWLAWTAYQALDQAVWRPSLPEISAIKNRQKKVNTALYDSILQSDDQRQQLPAPGQLDRDPFSTPQP